MKYVASATGQILHRKSKVRINDLGKLWHLIWKPHFRISFSGSFFSTKCWKDFSGFKAFLFDKFKWRFLSYSVSDESSFSLMYQFNIKVPSFWRFINSFSQVDFLRCFLIWHNDVWGADVIFLFENWLLLFMTVFGVLCWQNSWTFNVGPVVETKKHVFLKFIIKSKSTPKINWIPRWLLFLIIRLFWRVFIINLFFCGFNSKSNVSTECEAHIFRTWASVVVFMCYRLFCPITLQFWS